MTEHPLHSDKDNHIRNLEALVVELKRKNENLERANENLSGFKQRERRERIGKVLKVSSLVVFFASLATGGAFGAYRCGVGMAYFNKRCTNLCKMAIGDLVVEGYSSRDDSCEESKRHCVCRTRFGSKVTLPRTHADELKGDLSRLLNKLDVASWRRCMNTKDTASGSFLSELQCSHVPWMVNFNGKAEQNRVDGGNN